MNSSTITQTATVDQTTEQADDLAFARKAQKVAAAVWAIALVLAVYVVLAGLGFVPAAPWSPLGQ